MHKDMVSYTVILLLSAFFLFMTVNMPVTDVTVVNSALFPRIILTGLILMSGLGIMSTLKSGKRELVKPTHYQFYIGLAMIIGFVLLLRNAGFVIAAGTFLTVFSLYMMGKFKAIHAVIIACSSFAVAYGINYIFTEILGFILP